MCWFTCSWATEIEAIASYALFVPITSLHFICLPEYCTCHGSEPPKYLPKQFH